MATQSLNQLAATAAIAALLAASSSFADAVDDSILRAETQMTTLDQADAYAASSQDYALAQRRLTEARTARDRRQDNVATHRAEEASLLAELIQEHIKLSALEKSQQDLLDSLAVLRRETSN